MRECSVAGFDWALRFDGVVGGCGVGGRELLDSRYRWVPMVFCIISNLLKENNKVGRFTFELCFRTRNYITECRFYLVCMGSLQR